MLCTRLRFLRLRLESGQRSKSCPSNNSKTALASLTKLNRNIKHNEKVCRELVSCAHGQGHDQVRVQIVPKIMLLINY